MALFTPGPTVAAISGSIGGTTFARNRYGMYARNRSIPVVSTTPAALNAKARMATISQQFQSLTNPQKLAWQAWCTTNPGLNRLGQQIVLSANAAYVSLNTRLHYLGIASIVDPPLEPAPVALLTLLQTCDLGATTFDLAYTATPLAADDMLWITSCVTDSSGINWVQNLLRLIGVTAAAQASPFDHQTLLETRFGTLQEGQTVHTQVAVVDSANGQISPALSAKTLIEDTV